MQSQNPGESEPAARPESVLIRFLASLCLTYLVAFAAIELSLPGLRGWYSLAEGPSWQPPAQWVTPLLLLVFGCAGVAGWLAIRRNRGTATLCLWAANVVLLGAWCVLFFARQAFVPALAESAVLFVSAAAALVWYFLVSKPAGLLQCLVLLWDLWAAATSLAAWRASQGR